MIIELHDFGPIERFSFDTEKQMYFIFGENNVGKSYAISAVYLILKNWKISLENIKKSDGKDIFYSFTIDSIKDKIGTIQEKIDLTEEFSHAIGSLLSKSFLTNLENSFSTSFSSVEELFNKFSRKMFRIIIRNTYFSFSICQEKNSLKIENITLKRNVFLESHDAFAIYKLQFFNFKGQVYGSSATNENEINSFLLSTISQILENAFSNSIYFLPASRSGIYNGLSAFSAIIVQLTQLRNQIPNFKLDIPTLTEPISDYFLNISNINGKGYNTPFSHLAKKIEDKIIKGKISFDKSNRKLYYEPESLDFSLELSQASSMISEIAPIIAHLKYILSENQGEIENNFLFIEEPEAHLHPKIQVELMRLFAELAESGLHIVMTSHSNYLFNKLSNMVLAKEIDPQTISVCLMRMGEKGSFVDENAMQIDEDGIDDDNFSDVAEALYDERLKLYEQNPS